MNERQEIGRKRRELKALLGQLAERASAANHPALARTIWGQTVVTDAGRYDDRLDTKIAEAKQALKGEEN